MADFSGKGVVAAVKTSPETILEDIDKVMRLAHFDSVLPKGIRTGLKINISWQTWYPACSTEPWQLEGVIQTLRNSGYDDLVGVQSDLVHQAAHQTVMRLGEGSGIALFVVGQAIVVHTVALARMDDGWHQVLVLGQEGDESRQVRAERVLAVLGVEFEVAAPLLR